MLLLRLLHRTRQVAAAHAELDRDIAFLMLAVDEGRARDQPDIGDRRQRHGNGRAPGRVGGVHDNMPDGVQAVAVLRRQPHDDGIIAVAARLIQIARGLAADRRLDHRIDVAGGQPEARGPRPVDPDLDGGLAQRIEHRQIGDARHLLPSPP